MLVIDLTDFESYESIHNKWLKIVEDNCVDKNFVVVVLANKCDMKQDRKVN